VPRPSDVDAAFAATYRELRRLARRALRGEQAGHTLDSGALVHESWLRLRAAGAGTEIPWLERSHFLGVAARAMRAVLVDHARARRTAKRGGGRGTVPIDNVDVAVAPTDEADARILALGEALDRLAREDAEAAQIVELRHFVGLTLEEIAVLRGVSLSTVRRRWAFAKAWLATTLGDVHEGAGDAALGASGSTPA
jgi:RNA polymerase sigma factor (TIGR02999 family)